MVEGDTASPSDSSSPVTTRRVVVGQRADGAPYVVSDGESMRSHDFLAIPGMSESVLWSTRVGDRRDDSRDHALRVRRRLPRPGDTVFLTVTFPPDSVFTSDQFDARRAAAEQSLISPDLADCMEPEGHGMHATPTTDLVVVLEGEVWLDLGEGEPVHLYSGDTVVQLAVRHAWRNPTTKSATLAVVMVGIDEGGTGQ